MATTPPFLRNERILVLGNPAFLRLLKMLPMDFSFQKKACASKFFGYFDSYFGILWSFFRKNVNVRYLCVDFLQFQFHKKYLLLHFSIYWDAFFPWPKFIWERIFEFCLRKVLRPPKVKNFNTKTKSGIWEALIF